MRAGTPASSKDSFMYWAAALLPSSLPRSAMVVGPLARGAGEAPVRWDRFSRIEGSSIEAAAAWATFDGGPLPEASLIDRAGVFGMLLEAPSSLEAPQLASSAPRVSAETSRRTLSIAVIATRPASILRLTFALLPGPYLRPSPLRRLLAYRSSLVRCLRLKEQRLRTTGILHSGGNLLCSIGTAGTLPRSRRYCEVRVKQVGPFPRVIGRLDRGVAWERSLPKRGRRPLRGTEILSYLLYEFGRSRESHIYKGATLERAVSEQDRADHLGTFGRNLPQ